MFGNFAAFAGGDFCFVFFFLFNFCFIFYPPSLAPVPPLPPLVQVLLLYNDGLARSDFEQAFVKKRKRKEMKRKKAKKKKSYRLEKIIGNDFWFEK